MFHFINMQVFNKNKAQIVIFLSDTRKTHTHSRSTKTEILEVTRRQKLNTSTCNFFQHSHCLTLQYISYVALSSHKNVRIMLRFPT